MSPVTTWVDLPEDSPFPATNLPYGVFSHDGEAPRVGVALGDDVVDLAPLAAVEGLDGAHVFEAPTLNPFLAMGRPSWSAVRSWLVELVTHEGYRDLVESHLVPQSEVTLHLPFDVADYVDFYSSQHHAENVGRIFRPDSEALTPNWKHLPIGYHGRAGTVVVSGTDVVRPSGQYLAAGDDAPSFGPSRRLDIELELGFGFGTPSRVGEPVSPQRWAMRSRRGTSGSTSSGSAWSTTGARATCRPGSTSRWGRSWASPSPPPCRRGWCPWTRSATPGCRVPSRRPRSCPTWCGTRTGVSTCGSRCPGTDPSSRGRPSRRCTGPLTSSSRT
jgi:hypothetical protein